MKFRLPRVPDWFLFGLVGGAAAVLLLYNLIIVPNTSYVPQATLAQIDMSRALDTDSMFQEQGCVDCGTVTISEPLPDEEVVAVIELKPDPPKVATKPKPPRIVPEKIKPPIDYAPLPLPHQEDYSLAKALPGNPLPTLKPQEIIGGMVMVRLVITKTGKVRSASVEISSGSQRQDEAAVAAFRKWKFTPATREGEAVQSIIYLPMNYG